MNEPMTFLDFFSGVGGFRKGFELCGMVCKGHCEIDKFADRSYRAIHDVKEDEWYGEDINNHSGDKSGVLCMSGECPDRTEKTALIQLKRGTPKILEQEHTKCLIAGYDKIGVSNRGESSGIFMAAVPSSLPTGKTSGRTDGALRRAANPPFV